MPSIGESLDQSKLSGPLDAGVDMLSDGQQITFTQYVKLILPLDGYIFWVRADLVSKASLCGCQSYSPAPANGTSPPGNVLTVAGSLHYATQVKQEEDQTLAQDSVVFTAESEVNDLNRVGPCMMYIGEFDGRKFAFSRRGSFYKQSGLWHYSGDAVYPALETQLINDVSKIDTSNVIVSNSLPIWLTLNQFMPMYPSFLIEPNLEPPYAAVHIVPDSTTAIGAAPLLDRQGSHSQLASEKVKITLFGLRNFSALDFQDYFNQFTLDYPHLMGASSMPIMRDGKRIQTELGVIAQMKIFEVEVNYYQRRAREFARQYILQCIPEIIVEGGVQGTIVAQQGSL